MGLFRRALAACWCPGGFLIDRRPAGLYYSTLSMPSVAAGYGVVTCLPAGRFDKEESMPVPKRRTSKARKGKRRSHHALVPVQTVVCKQCGHAMLPHTVCGHCGTYRGRKVLQVEEE